MVGGGAKKLLKKILICIVLGVNLGFTRIQFFQHMFLKKTKKEPHAQPYNLFVKKNAHFFVLYLKSYLHSTNDAHGHRFCSKG